MSCSPFSGWNAGARVERARSPRRTLEVVGVVMAFFYWWPLAVAYIAWRALGSPAPSELRAEIDRVFGGVRDAVGGGWTGGGFGRTGNLAFDDYRRSEIERLEAERRKLDEEARSFRSFVEELKRAKDREEFDAYMARRRSGQTAG